MLLDYIEPDELITPSDSKLHDLGDQYLDPGTNTLYEYIQYNAGSGSVLAALNKPAGIYKAGGSPFVVTADISDSDAASFRGVLQAAIASGSYGWIARHGPTNGLVDNTGALSAPGPLKWSGDGTFDGATIGTDHIVANLLANVANLASGTTATAINLL